MLNNSWKTNNCGGCKRD